MAAAVLDVPQNIDLANEATPAIAPVAALVADHAPEEFRNYVDSALHDRVANFYKHNHKAQTFALAKQLRAAFDSAPEVKMTVWEAMSLLDTVVDESDPDLDAAQTFHAFQTAEAARRLYPDLKWLHLAGLIHDAGKVLATAGLGAFPQSFVVGDTFPTGCRYAEKIVFYEFFEHNPDANVPEFQTDCGIYEPHCGLSNLMMSYGHDEYLYQVLKASDTKLPEEAMYIVRFHSFYSHHQHKAYAHLMNEFDENMLDVLRQFQPCDLYSKSYNFPPMSELKPYYEGLLQEFGLDKPLSFRKMTLPASAGMPDGHESAAAATA